MGSKNSVSSVGITVGTIGSLVATDTVFVVVSGLEVVLVVFGPQ